MRGNRTLRGRFAPGLLAPERDVARLGPVSTLPAQLAVGTLSPWSSKGVRGGPRRLAPRLAPQSRMLASPEEGDKVGAGARRQASLR